MFQALSEPVDLLIVGGGINGVGIARDAAGRGLSVLLCEQSDLASATSSASTKLIHGGLRYLEHYEFRLVREALIEREVLLRAAPHIIWPLDFVLPHDRNLRPAWLIRMGLFLYDHLGGRERLHGSRGLKLRQDPYGAPLKESFRKGFCYADCWVEDSRLVVLNAMDAAERGAEVATRTRCLSAQRRDGLWEARLQSGEGGGERLVRARALVNAAGPWVTEVRSRVTGSNRGDDLRLVKGSHIVVPRLFEGEQAYIFQHPDQRVIFAIPYEESFTLIGTTDVPFQGDPAEVAITESEIGYLCEAVSHYFDKPVSPADVVWTYAGVRPLYDDAAESASTVTRDYVLNVDGGEDRPPLLSVFGGKITTYRKLAEHALSRLLPLLGRDDRPWTESAGLPGGDIPDLDVSAFRTALAARWPWLPAPLLRRYVRAYGTRVEALVGQASCLEDLGRLLAEGLYEAEADYLLRCEWARSADDILWRRSKLGLHLPAEAQANLAAWLDGRSAPDARRAALQ